MSSSGLSTLRKLSEVIRGSIDKIELTLAAQSLDFPSIDSIYSQDSEAARNIPEVLHEIHCIVAAAGQPIATARAPTLAIFDAMYMYHVSSATKVALDSDIAEVLRDHGPTHVSGIAEQQNIDLSKLARCLRLLATKSIFRETAPDTFTNNRVSSMLDSGRSLEELAKDRAAKDVGIPAFVGLSLDDSFKGSAYMADVLLDPKTAFSTSPTDTALGRAWGFEGGIMFDWFDKPENIRKRRRFAAGMDGLTRLTNPFLVLEGFEWKALPQGSLVVDVGGGHGSQTLTLARQFPGYKYIIQDRPVVRDSADLLFSKEFPTAMSSGLVEFEGHDFFNPQPIRDVAVFLMRQILHNWPDDHCVKILKHLRAIARPDTQLLIIDQILLYACEDQGQGNKHTSKREIPPEPLLSNWGEANTFAYMMDMQMLMSYHSMDRTLPQFQAILDRSGWKVVDVRSGPRPFAVLNETIIAIPA